jgi:hypothetical protein
MMKWLFLIAILFSVVVLFLRSSAPIDADALHTPSPGSVALPFMAVLVLFVAGVGIAELARNG